MYVVITDHIADINLMTFGTLKEAEQELRTREHSTKGYGTRHFLFDVRECLTTLEEQIINGDGKEEPVGLLSQSAM